jgi:hypothetical protein
VSGPTRATAIARAAARQIAIVAGYAALALALSWPLARDFTTRLAGSGLDGLGHLWGLWHTAQAVAGREPFFSSTLLYYPAGIALLPPSSSVIAGMLALPFWPLGAAAAYNGGLLVGLAATGYAMYLFARELGGSQAAALSAGVVLLSAPVHLDGLRGQPTSVFLGLLPLAFAALWRALGERHSIPWAVAFGAALLVLLLHSPSQFVQFAFCVPIVIAGAVLAAAPGRAVAIRTARAALAALVIAGPLALATFGPDAAMTSLSDAEVSRQQPDATQLIRPPSFSLAFGSRTLRSTGDGDIGPEVGAEIAIPAVVILLGVAALVKTPRTAGAWIAIGLWAAVLSLGSTLRLAGRDTETPLPFGWIAARAAAFDVLHPSSQFMQIAFVGFAAAAALGLTHVTRRTRHGWVLSVVATAAVLMQVWPRPWPTTPLPAVPGLYTALARDGEDYGVFDLPVRSQGNVTPIEYSARYQALQMTHGKGIAGGAVARTYSRHPVSPCLFAGSRVSADVLVDGTPSRCEPAAIHQLAASGYRYVVWHLPPAAADGTRPRTFAIRDTESFVLAAFPGRRPDISDGVIRAWRLPSPDLALPATPVLELTTGWYPAEPRWRWARSPAAIRITSARAQQATLVLAVALVHGLGSPAGLAKEGVLIVTNGNDTSSFAIKPDEVVRVPVSIRRGITDITLALGAGNFSPSNYGLDDRRTLSLAVQSIDLVTTSGVPAP